MKMRKEWWYVFAIIVLALVLMIVFRDDINFSPGKKVVVNTESSSLSDLTEYVLGLDSSFSYREQKSIEGFRDLLISSYSSEVSDE